MKTQIIYRGVKPEARELLRLMPMLDITWTKNNDTLQTVIDPIYNIKRLDWEWMRSLFTGENVVRVLLLEAGELKGIGINDHWGFYSLDNDGIHDFYMTNLRSDDRAIANDFRSPFTWMFVHEYLHGAVWSTTGNRSLAATLVHEWEAQGILKTKLAELLTKDTEMNFLFRQLNNLLAILKGMVAKPTLLSVCKSYIGKDASPADLAPDELGCAETVTNLLRKVYPEVPIMLGTIGLLAYMKDPTKGFVQVSTPTPECIVMSVTRFVDGVRHTGHTGIVGEGGIIMSNASFMTLKGEKGTFQENYTVGSWNTYFGSRGFPVLFFKHK